MRVYLDFLEQEAGGQKVEQLVVEDGERLIASDYSRRKDIVKDCVQSQSTRSPQSVPPRVYFETYPTLVLLRNKYGRTRIFHCLSFSCLPPIRYDTIRYALLNLINSIARNQSGDEGGDTVLFEINSSHSHARRKPASFASEWAFRDTQSYD